ncbi:MAG: SDR family oxidoreductase [Janthinobacterium lividum]
MLAITGATGHLGQATIKALLTKVPATDIVAVVRDPQKATDLQQQGVQVRRGNYDDATSLVAAFQGIDIVFLVSGTDLVHRAQQHQRVIDAAKQAGVQRLVYTSVLNPSQTSHFGASPSHFATEEYLLASGLTYTVLRNTLYLDLVPGLVGKDAVSSGKFFFAAGDGKVSYALREEIAQASANALTSGEHENKIYDIAPTPAYSMHDVATALSEVTGQPVAYVPVSVEDMAAGMRQHHVPEPIVEMMGGIGRAMDAGEFDVTSPAFEQLLGRKPTDLKTYLAAVQPK